MQSKITIVSPVYGAEKMLDQLVERLKVVLDSLTNDYEIILVDDCGPDNSWDKIQENARKYSFVKGIRLSRNFGQHYAITAGLDYAQGEWIVVMDCDLQDRPEEIPNLLAKALEGYDIVLARRHERRDNFFKKLFSRAFYGVLGYLTGSHQDSSIANFGIYHRKVVEAVIKMRESIRYFPTMIRWVGFRRTAINVEHAEREEGKSSYNMKKLLNLALDIMLAYSDKPLRMTVKAGLIISISALLVAFYNVIYALVVGFAVLGYASLMVSIWFLGGLIILTLGIIGLYIGKTFEGVKNRPIYLVNESVNIPSADAIRKKQTYKTTVG